METSQIKEHAKSIRKKIIMMLHRAGSGHTGGSLGMSDVFATLYFDILDDHVHSSKHDRDRFILSNGHICPVWYATLAQKKIIKEEDLLTLREVDSVLQGHPANKELPLVELSTGSLGQGFPAAVGLALGYKKLEHESTIYVGLGDGEMQEGSIWEALMFAGHNKLDNLVAFVDRNFIQQGGKTEEMLSLEPLADKIKAFNWHVINADGHDIGDIKKAFHEAKSHKGEPSFIIFKTHLGQGVSFVKDDFNWHGKAPNDEQYEQALAELN